MPALAARRLALTPAVIAALAAVAGATVATAAWAQPVVWRCDAGGVSGYSDQPCQGGRAVDVADARSTAQVRQGLEVAERERRMLAMLVAERAQRERVSAGGAAGIGESPRAPLAYKAERSILRRHTTPPGQAPGRAIGRQPNGDSIRPARPAA